MTTSIPSAATAAIWNDRLGEAPRASSRPSRYCGSSRHAARISAGHGPILFYDVRNHRFEELAVHDIPLGVKADWPFHENDREVWPQEGLIVIGTDGLWETLNVAGEAFGKEGLTAVLQATAHLTAAEICAQVIEQVRAFAGSVPQADDMTVVVIKFTPHA